jgi:hypothetical protein
MAQKSSLLKSRSTYPKLKASGASPNTDAIMENSGMAIAISPEYNLLICIALIEAS